MEQHEIEKRLVKLGDVLGFGVNGNFPNIAKVKSRMENWRRCPCDPKNEHHYCGSMLCEEDTKRDGHCHCNLYLLRQECSSE